MARPIRIAFALDNMHPGGTELNAVRLAERLDRDRFDVRVICWQNHGPLLERYAAAGIPVEYFPLRSLYSRSALRQGVRLTRFLRSEQIAIVHAHDIYSNAFAVPCGRLAGVRTIASRRWWEGFPGPAWQFVSRTAYRLADAVLANSTSVAARLQRIDGVPPGRIVVVPNFLDDSAFQRPPSHLVAALRNELRLDGTAPVVGIVANLLPIKDHASLLRAASTLRARWPGLRVVLVGDGPSRHSLEQLAADLSLTDNVVFAGRRPNVPNLHHLFDVSVLCSTSEGLPNSVLEAMAAARPVVATRVGAVGDAVLDGETGVLVPAADHVQLAAALETLLSDRGRATRMGETAATRARQHYSAGAALNALENLYLRLVERRPGRAPAISRGHRPTGPDGRQQSVQT